VRALLVEDDATIAEFVARGLREAGFAVDHFADGEAGLIAAPDQPYDRDCRPAAGEVIRWR